MLSHNTPEHQIREKNNKFDVAFKQNTTAEKGDKEGIMDDLL